MFFYVLSSMYHIIQVPKEYIINDKPLLSKLFSYLVNTYLFT